MTIEPILITITEASKLLNISNKTMYKLVKIKGFPAIIFPHKILVDKNQLPIWVSKNYGNFKN